MRETTIQGPGRYGLPRVRGWWLLGWLALAPNAAGLEGGSSPVAGPPVRLLVSIDQVDDLEAYLRADQALAALAGVADRELVEVAPRQLLYRLRVPGGLRALRASLAGNGTLGILPPTPVSDEDVEPDLQLRLRP